MNNKKLIKKCRDIIECDAARISYPGDTLFLIIGFNRNTKQDEGQWFNNEKRIDFDYVQEKVVASGKTEEELLSSVKEYACLLKMSMKEYFSELGWDTRDLEWDLINKNYIGDSSVG